jgi:NADH-quinone oxidoreductase subunit B
MSQQPEPFPNDPMVPPELSNNVFVTTLDKLYNWGRKRSMWPIMFGLACCAIEMICTAAGRYDLERFGAGLMRPSPRQADLMIVSGTVTKKMVPTIVRLYNQMPEPKYVLSMGACATSGGPFKEGYNVVSGIDKFLPVDVYVPGCPPKPEALLHGLLKLFEKIESQSITNVPWYRKTAIEAIPVPILGPDLIDPRRAVEIRELSAQRAQVAAPAAEAKA